MPCLMIVDVTTASGISMKQYEDQLNSLRKENFHLKLRIYFLEEKLGTGSPPAVQVSVFRYLPIFKIMR